MEAGRLVTASLRHAGPSGSGAGGAHEEFHSANGESMLIVAEGTHDRGSAGVASALCVDALGEAFLASADPPMQRLRQGLSAAREAVAKQASRNPAMASLDVSAVAMIFEPLGTAWLAWLDGCAAYRIRSGRVQRLTEARPEADPDEGAAVLRVEVQSEDAFVLCSLGLLDCLSEADLGKLASEYSPRKAAREIERRVSAHAESGSVTAQVVAVNAPVAVRAVDWVAPVDDGPDIYARPEPRRRIPAGVWMSAAGLVSAVALGGGAYVLYASGAFERAQEAVKVAIATPVEREEADRRIARVRERDSAPKEVEPVPKRQAAKPESVRVAQAVPEPRLPVARSEPPPPKAPKLVRNRAPEPLPGPIEAPVVAVVERPSPPPPVIREQRVAPVREAMRRPVVREAEPVVQPEPVINPEPVAQRRSERLRGEPVKEAAPVEEPAVEEKILVAAATPPALAQRTAPAALPAVEAPPLQARAEVSEVRAEELPARRMPQPAPVEPAYRQVQDFLDSWERAVSDHDFDLYQSLGLQLTRDQFERSYVRRERVGLHFRLIERKVISPGRMSLRLFMTYSYWDGSATQSTERERSIEVSSTVQGLRYIRNLR